MLSHLSLNKHRLYLDYPPVLPAALHKPIPALLHNIFGDNSPAFHTLSSSLCAALSSLANVLPTLDFLSFLLPTAACVADTPAANSHNNPIAPLSVHNQ